MATVWLGTAPKIAWGFPFLVCREQGSSMGAGTRLPLFATQGGGGEEAAGKVLNPARSPELWQGQATKKPPILFPRDREAEFLPLGEQTPFSCSRLTLPPPWATDGPWAQGPTVRAALAVSLACKYLLSAYCVPKFLSPQGAVTMPLPKLKLWGTYREM